MVKIGIEGYGCWAGLSSSHPIYYTFTSVFLNSLKLRFPEKLLLLIKILIFQTTLCSMPTNYAFYKFLAIHFHGGRMRNKWILRYSVQFFCVQSEKNGGILESQTDTMFNLLSVSFSGRIWATLLIYSIFSPSFRLWGKV